MLFTTRQIKETMKTDDDTVADVTFLEPINAPRMIVTKISKMEDEEAFSLIMLLIEKCLRNDREGLDTLIDVIIVSRGEYYDTLTGVVLMKNIKNIPAFADTSFEAKDMSETEQMKDLRWQARKYKLSDGKTDRFQLTDSLNECFDQLYDTITEQTDARAQLKCLREYLPLLPSRAQMVTHLKGIILFTLSLRNKQSETARSQIRKNIYRALINITNVEIDFNESVNNKSQYYIDDLMHCVTKMPDENTDGTRTPMVMAVLRLMGHPGGPTMSSWLSASTLRQMGGGTLTASMSRELSNRMMVPETDMPDEMMLNGPDEVKESAKRVVAAKFYKQSNRHMHELMYALTRLDTRLGASKNKMLIFLCSPIPNTTEPQNPVRYKKMREYERNGGSELAMVRAYKHRLCSWIAERTKTNEKQERVKQQLTGMNRSLAFLDDATRSAVMSQSIMRIFNPALDELSQDLIQNNNTAKDIGGMLTKETNRDYKEMNEETKAKGQSKEQNPSLLSLEPEAQSTLDSTKNYQPPTDSQAMPDHSGGRVNGPGDVTPSEVDDTPV